MDFKPVLGFYASNKQAYLIICDDVVTYAIQNGITSVNMPGPNAWYSCEEHAASHKYLTHFRAAFNGRRPEKYVEIVWKAIKYLCIDTIKKKNAARVLADR